MGEALRTLTQARIMPPLARGRILLVDDELADLAQYCMLLTGRGYSVRPFASFTKGAASLATRDFDLVIVAQGSAEFEGRLVLESAGPKDRRLPVLVVARAVNMSCYLDAMLLGAVEYIEKPHAPWMIVYWADRYVRRRERVAV